jgi:serine/threonine-protein kinase
METNLDVPSEPDPPLPRGTLVGDYRLLAHLGSGAFGDVYAAEHAVLGRRVAIKLLRRKLSANAEAVARFVAEARAVGKIRHHNLVDVFAFGTFEGERQFYAMELLEGITLGALLDRETRLDPARALPILEGIAAALDATHAAGVVHRDLKPDNVFLAREADGSYTPKLLDFGIAKLLGEDIGVKTATGIAMGTPRYMSPEQCRGKKVDHRADIYALGVVAHEVLTGAPPFRGDALVDLMLKHTVEAPPRVSEARPELPSALDGPVLAMLAKRPQDRPVTAGQAIAALSAALRGEAEIATQPLGSKALPALPSRDAGPPTVVDRRPPALSPKGTVLLHPPPNQPRATPEALAATTLATPGAPRVEPAAPTKLSPGASPAPTPTPPGSLSIADSIPRPPVRSNTPAIAVLAALSIGAIAIAAFFVRRGDDRAPVSATAPTAAPTVAAIASTAAVTDTTAPTPIVVPSAALTAPPIVSTEAPIPAKPSAAARSSPPRPSAAVPPPAGGKGRDIGF